MDELGISLWSIIALVTWFVLSTTWCVVVFISSERREIGWEVIGSVISLVSTSAVVHWEFPAWSMNDPNDLGINLLAVIMMFIYVLHIGIFLIGWVKLNHKYFQASIGEYRYG